MASALSATAFRSLWERCASHRDIRNAKRFAVAFSGGPDSLCLLFLLQRYLKSIQSDQSIVSLTINHDLQAASTLMTARCRELSASVGIPNVAMSIPWSQYPFPPKPLPGRAIEEIARSARSQLLFDAMQEHKCDVLVMGHHADDQVETALMRLLRQLKGSQEQPGMNHVDLTNATTRSCRRWGMGATKPGSLGAAGLPGMQKWILRPLITVPKVTVLNPQSRLIATCEEEHLDYVQDVTNFDPALTPRNAVRAVLAGREEVKALSEHETHRINTAIDIARDLAGGSTRLGTTVKADANALLRAWVAQLDRDRETLDRDVDRLISAFSAPSPPSTFLLRTNRLLSSKIELADSLKHGLIRRILRYVSPRGWGSVEANAHGRKASFERIAEQVLKRVEPDELISSFGAGSDVLWKPVIIEPDGSIKQLGSSRTGGRPEIGWLAYRCPPRAADKSTFVDITSLVRRVLADESSSEEIELLWDCRFELKFKPKLLPHNVQEALSRGAEKVSIIVDAVGPSMLPTVVFRKGVQKKAWVVLGGYPKPKKPKQHQEKPWVDIRFVRELTAV